MKVDLILNHVLGKKGDTISVSQPRGDYLIRMGVAQKHVAKPKEVEKVEKVEEEKPKPKKETKPKTKAK